ncbi:hypothetical protein B296_00010770 [Ensete ventricosum]|uniref:Uncharacterized protein n=1 Tax=Ensete ventricosum TaxID=4639 RepID=A0A426ZNV0_ENSVE|nr:hypothetical protein B296_00010770 [Ensete ventricosum]
MRWAISRRFSALPREAKTASLDSISSIRCVFGIIVAVDVRVLRDLEVMKAGHDLDTTMTEGSLATIREQYSILPEYRLHVLQPRQCPYSSNVPGVCISVDALEASL